MSEMIIILSQKIQNHHFYHQISLVIFFCGQNFRKSKLNVGASSIIKMGHEPRKTPFTVDDGYSEQ